MSLKCKLWAGERQVLWAHCTWVSSRPCLKGWVAPEGWHWVFFSALPVPHMHHQPPSFHYWRFLFYYFVLFWLRSKINLQDLQGTCTKKAAWAAWQYWTKRRALGSQGLTWNLWIKNLNAVSCGRWMDVISEMPAWFLALSETSEVFCTDSSDLEAVCLAMLSSGKISCGCRALSSTGVICSSFLKAPQAGKGVLMKWWSWWWSVWDWPLQVG